MTEEIRHHGHFESLDAARESLEESAECIVERCGGYWKWLDERTLRIFTAKDQPAMTFTVEQTQ
jgi:hypothetical protein